MICFDLFYLGLLWSYDPDHGFGRLTSVDSGPICCSLNNFFKKNMLSLIFLVKLYFYQSFKLSLNSSSQSDLIDSALTSLLLFKFE